MVNKYPFDTLPQLDRIEYLAKRNFIEKDYLIGLLYVLTGIIVALDGNIFSIVFYCVGLWFMVSWWTKSKELKKEYFKVVKK